MSQPNQSSKYHLNTVYVQPQRQMTLGPYESLKHQISLQNYFNPRYVQKHNQNQLQQSMDELKKLMAGDSNVDKNKIARIEAIKLKPVVNENFISSFDQTEYKLAPEDKVKIVKEKVFRVQNYYNYLYELKCNEQYQKVNTTVQQFLKSSKADLSPKLKQKQKYYQRSPYQSEFNQNSGEFKSHFTGKSGRQELAPEYTKYQEKSRGPTQQFFLKQKDRKKVELQYSRISNQNINRSSYPKGRYEDDYKF